jgi:hypothetical protein
MMPKLVDIIYILVIILSVIYNVIVLPKLDEDKLELFNDIKLRLLVISSIIVLSKSFPLLSLFLALSFVLTHIRLYKLSKKKETENFISNQDMHDYSFNF